MTANEQAFPCLSDVDIERYHSGAIIDEASRSTVRTHLDICTICRRREAVLLAEHDEILDHLRSAAGGSHSVLNRDQNH